MRKNAAIIAWLAAGVLIALALWTSLSNLNWAVIIKWLPRLSQGALLTLALKSGVDGPTLHAQLPRSDAIPFESEHRFMATLHHDHAGHGLIYLKGAPERVLEMCSNQRSADGSSEALDTDYWRRQATDLAARGLRLLALASKPATAEQRTLNFADVESGLTLLALVLFMLLHNDPGALPDIPIPATEFPFMQLKSLVGLTLVVLALALAFLLGNYALQYGATRLAAGTTALVMLSEVVFASVSSALLTAAPLEPRTLLGGSLIMLAALLAALQYRRSASA